MQDYIIIINFIAIVQFFYIIFIAIIDYLLAFKRENNFLRLFSYYYNIMAINDYNILHLHYILQLNKNLNLIDLKNQLFENKYYTTQIITYLNIIIFYYIDKNILQTLILLSNQCINLSLYKCKSDFNQLILINYNSNIVIVIK